MFHNSINKVYYINDNITFLPQLKFFFFKIFGIATVSFKPKWIDQNKKWHWAFTSSVIDILYNVFLIVLLVVMNTIGINYMIKTDYLGRFKQDKFTIASLDTLIALSVIFILTIYCTRQKKIFFILNKISILRELFMRTIKNSVSCRNAQFQKISMLSVGHVIITIIMLPILAKNEIYLAIYTASFNFCIFIINIVLIQYSVILKLIKIFFEIINEKLQNVTNIPLWPVDVQSISIIKLETKLDHLIQMHCLISELAQEISDFYSLPMLVCTFNIFIDLLVCSYTVIKEIIFSNSLLIMNNILNIAHIYFNIISLATLTINVTETIQEVNFLFKTF